MRVYVKVICVMGMEEGHVSVCYRHVCVRVLLCVVFFSLSLLVLLYLFIVLRRIFKMMFIDQVSEFPNSRELGIVIYTP